MEMWRKVWRDGIVPLLSNKALVALWHGLVMDDPRLIQGGTVFPEPVPSSADQAPLAACALGYCGWQGEGLETVAEVEEFFVFMCFEIDQRLGEPAGCRWWLNWFDETPRAEVRRELLCEVNLALVNQAKITSADEHVTVYMAADWLGVRHKDN
jgi:hypothetical protein